MEIGEPCVYKRTGDVGGGVGWGMGRVHFRPKEKNYSIGRIRQTHKRKDTDQIK